MLNRVGPILVLLGLLLAGAPPRDAPAAEGPAGTPTNTLQAVDYATVPGGAALVRVVFSDALRAPPGVMVNHHPIHRIAFDFPGTVSAAGRQPVEVGQRGLRRIQVVQSGTRTRLILELDRTLQFETALEGKVLLITLRRPDAGAADDPRYEIREVGFQRGESGEGRIVVEISDATVPIEVRRQGNALVVDFIHARVPPQLARRLEVQDFGTPVKAIETYNRGNHARLTAEVAGATELAVYQFDRRLVLAPLH
ncbi:MAG: AMIN domain-containing protein [Burkholderiales bacterium]